jgi:hypothetical protein
LSLHAKLQKKHRVRRMLRARPSFRPHKLEHLSMPKFTVLLRCISRFLDEYLGPRISGAMIRIDAVPAFIFRCPSVILNKQPMALHLYQFFRFQNVKYDFYPMKFLFHSTILKTHSSANSHQNCQLSFSNSISPMTFFKPSFIPKDRSKNAVPSQHRQRLDAAGKLISSFRLLLPVARKIALLMPTVNKIASKQYIFISGKEPEEKQLSSGQGLESTELVSPIYRSIGLVPPGEKKFDANPINFIGQRTMIGKASLKEAKTKTKIWQQTLHFTNFQLKKYLARVQTKFKKELSNKNQFSFITKVIEYGMVLESVKETLHKMFAVPPALRKKEFSYTASFNQVMQKMIIRPQYLKKIMIMHSKPYTRLPETTPLEMLKRETIQPTNLHPMQYASPALSFVYSDVRRESTAVLRSIRKVEEEESLKRIRFETQKENKQLAAKINRIPSATEITEQVYHQLSRRLRLEKERLGFR